MEFLNRSPLSVVVVLFLFLLFYFTVGLFFCLSCCRDYIGVQQTATNGGHLCTNSSTLTMLDKTCTSVSHTYSCVGFQYGLNDPSVFKMYQHQGFIQE